MPTPGFDLAALRAANAAKLSGGDLDAVAQRLGVEPAAIRAVVQVESAGAGFAPSGRPLILFEPSVFSELTGGRFDATHPNLSQSTPRPGGLGRTQEERWQRLAEAFALDPDAALKATSWGMFQIAGTEHVSAGFANVYAFASDISQSEARQLAAFEQVVRRKELSDELRNHDWPAFARIYNGLSGAENYGRALETAYVQAKRQMSGESGFLDTLVAKNAGRLTDAEITASAQRMGVEAAVVRAVLKVESNGGGFGSDGRAIVLYEPHIFSRLTNRRFDATHPTLSYRNWKERPYPRTQRERWAQIAEAYALDAEAALGAASWGLFQILGMNHQACGFASASAFVADISQSEVQMLKSFEAFVRNKGILDELQRKDWEGFARIYNGPGQVEKYGRWLREAYEQFAASA
jgi:soluble lytic murein transglycosylase-like protein